MLEKAKEELIMEKIEDPMIDHKTQAPRIFFHLILLILLAFFAFILGWTYLPPAPDSPGLGALVDAQLKESGVENRVTAVLLNFRAYDTLLECFVLFLGAVGVWSFTPSRLRWQEPMDNPILSSLVHLLVPLMIMIAGYLTWFGTLRAGGAFQGGTVLAGAVVLLLLASSATWQKIPLILLSFGLVIGPAFFLLTAIVCLISGARLFQYPMAYNRTLILLIEVVAALSISLSLAALFGGRRPDATDNTPGARG